MKRVKLKFPAAVLMAAVCVLTCGCRKDVPPVAVVENPLPVFMGVYVSVCVPEDNDFSELHPFDDGTPYDEFDAFDTGVGNKFTVETGLNGNDDTLLYSISYQIEQNKTPFFLPYLIVKEGQGRITALPLKDTVYAHSGVVHTLTQQLTVRTGLRPSNKEQLKVSFHFL